MQTKNKEYLLFIDKYRIQSFDELEFNHYTGDILKQLCKSDDIGHIILNGPTSCGKKTLVQLYLKEKYGKSIQIKNQIMEFKYSSKKIELQLLYSFYHYQMNLSLHGVYDKQLIQDFIKEIAQYNTISMKSPYRIIVLEHADQLTHEAQQSLRRTLEMYIGQCRFIFLTENDYNLIEPIRSRSMRLKLETPSSEVIKTKLKYICDCEKIKISDYVLDYLSSNFNLNKAINLLQIYNLKNPNLLTINSQTLSQTNESFSLVTKIIEDIHTLILSDKDADTILKIREKIYDLLVDCVEPLEILKLIYSYLLNKYSNNTLFIQQLNEYADYYDNTMRQGGKPIYHLEGLIIKLVECLH